MIKLKEFCCGCDVRTGTSIILWCTLVIDAVRSLFYITKILYGSPYSSYLYGESQTVTLIRDFFFLIACSVGIAVSAIGLFGLTKNRAEFVKLCYYYFLGYVGYWIFILVIIIIFPSWYENVTILSPFFGIVGIDEVENYRVVNVVAYLFILALTYYFVMTIKSHFDDMIKCKADDFNQEMPNPTTQSYVLSL